jgi:hypothetical protein
MPEAIMLPLLNPRPRVNVVPIFDGRRRVVVADFMLEAEALVGHAANNRAHFRNVADLKRREQAAAAGAGRAADLRARVEPPLREGADDRAVLAPGDFLQG